LAWPGRGVGRERKEDLCGLGGVLFGGGCGEGRGRRSPVDAIGDFLERKLFDASAFTHSVDRAEEREDIRSGIDDFEECIIMKPSGR
jgi:hypothetical protein